MSANLFRSISEPIRKQLTWDERWDRDDKGLIACWERGRVMSKEVPPLASLAGNGELVILPWKGGVEKSLKNRKKFGALQYLAMWQGLRGENLDINLTIDVVVICSRTKMEVTFTHDLSKLAEA